MRAPDATQLAALELRLCDLAHPDWLTLGAALLPQSGAASDDAQALADQPRALGIATAVSRWLIDDQCLAMLSPAWFSRSWSYAVLGGHAATLALHERTVAYLVASWVRSAVAGAHARALHSHFGSATYADALRRTEPLASWRAPCGLPEWPVAFVEEEAQRLLVALWQRHAPSLAPWARVMQPPASAHVQLDVDLDLDLRVGPARPPPSRALLDELDARLQTDFAIEIDASDADTDADAGDEDDADDA